MNYRNYSQLSSLIKKSIHSIKKNNYDLIVGIPRSGMVPAYMIALYLNLNCCDIEDLIYNRKLKSGSTRKIGKTIKYPNEPKRILLVDDSIHSGKVLQNTLTKIPKNIKMKITTFAIYSSEKKRDDIDYFLEYLPIPRVFEWNIFHHKIIERACFNVDGVLCADTSLTENDRGKRHGRFMLNSNPLIIPSKKINTLISSRPEKYRKETEEWLYKNEIEYETLIMLNLPSKKENIELGRVHATYKARIYKNSQMDLFFESDRRQAIKIHEITKKPVYCVTTNELFSKRNLRSFLNSSNRTKKHIMVKLLRKLPVPIYGIIKFISQKIIAIKRS